MKVRHTLKVGDNNDFFEGVRAIEEAENALVIRGRPTARGTKHPEVPTHQELRATG